LRLKAIRVRTRYWRPGTDWLDRAMGALATILENGDLVTVSEKAISTAEGLIVDESGVRAGALARLLAVFWTRKIWGGPLGRLTNLRQNTLSRLRSYPVEEGSAHKQVALTHSGFLQSLRHYSEGGIDASNLPFSMVSLPLPEPRSYAEQIRRALAERGKRVSVMIVDGDSTYTHRNLHLSPRRVDVPGLIHVGGFLTFVIGRMLGLKSRSTPVAVVGEPMNPDWALTMANVAHRVRGHGAGRTVWDMTETLETGLTGVTWEMLDEIKHFPIVVIRGVDEEA
jgi:F420-0:gamma-glutamyl ligase-like protein